MRLYLKFEVDWLNGSKYITFTRGMYSIPFKMFNGGHLDFSRWAKINSIRPLGGMTSEIKFEVDRWKDIVFTRGIYSIYFKKFNGGRIVFSIRPKINSVCPIDNMKTNFKFEVDWGNGFKDIAFTSI